MMGKYTSAEITSDIAKKLRDKGINSASDLWVHIGSDFDSGVDKLAGDAALDKKQLIDFLAAEGLRKGSERDASPIGRSWIGFKRNFLEVVAGAMLLLLIGLGIRALMLRDTALIAVRDLEPGQVLRPSDLGAVRLGFRNNYFKDQSELTGLVLTKRVASQRPIRFEDVSRLQVVAARDILANDIIKPDAVTLGWSGYQPGAKTDIKDVTDHKALKAIRAGDVILPEFIEYAQAP